MVQHGNPATPPSTGDPIIVDTMDDISGEKCEVKHLSQRMEDGELKTLEKKKPDGDKEVSFIQYALVSIQIFDEKNVPIRKKLQINSSHICTAIEEVVKFYPAQNLGFNAPIEVDQPFEMLFHHLEPLRKCQDGTAPTDDKYRHLEILFRYLYEDPDIQRSTELINNNLITFDLLSFIFKPGCYVLTSKYGYGCIYWLQSTYQTSDYMKGRLLRLECLYTDNDGTTTGMAHKSLTIYETEFPGTDPIEITSLSTFPLSQLFDESKNMKAAMLERGKWYCELMEKGSVLCRYDGICLEYNAHARQKWERYSIAGRVQIDTKAYLDENPSKMRKVTPWPESKDKSGGSTADRPDEYRILCPPYVYGFSMESRKWCRFFLVKDNLMDVKWDEDMWKDLILPEAQKKLLLSMVSSHFFPTESVLRDEVALKGKGLVVVSHGPPGTGKTLTAVAVAEETKKAVLLYPAGELGFDLDSVQTSVRKIVRYATRWQAILLIDEADIFLESRQSGGQANLQRNALVAVFLRQLEYSQGIIFLTSNRAQMFDAAIKSRVHLMLYYCLPTTDMRRKLWDQCLNKIPVDNLGLDKAKILGLITKHALNGREISNMVSSAQTLARSGNMKDKKNSSWKLNQNHLEDVLKIWKASNPPRAQVIAKTTLKFAVDMTVPALTLFILLGLAIIVSFHGYQVVVKKRDILILYSLRVCKMPAPTQIEYLKKTVQLNEHGHPTIQQNVGSSSGNAITFGTARDLTIKHYNNGPFQASPNDPYNSLIRVLGLPLPCPRGFLERFKREMTPETCKWLQQQFDFNKWVEGSSRIFWIVGRPGTGKTMLSVSTVEHLRTQIRSRDDSSGQVKELGFLPDTLVYYFCDSTGDPKRNTPSAIIGGLLRQLIENHRKFLKNNTFEGRYNADALFEVFESVLRELGSHFRYIYILLDGPDECESSLGGEMVGSLCRLMNEHDMKTKLLVTSRPVSWILSVLQARGISEFQIDEPKIVDDIKKTIKHKLKQASLNINPERRHNLEAYLLENSEGTFLWADLVIKNFDYAAYTLNTVEFDKLIDKIPSELNDIYDRIMSNVYRRLIEHRYSLDEVNFVLQFVTVAKRDLTALEIDMAFATWRNKTTGGSKIPPDIRSIQTNVYESCVPLVSFNSETKVVYFMHKSVSTYLLSERPRTLLSKMLGGTLHRYIVAPCLSMLSGIFRPDASISEVGLEPESSSRYSRHLPEVAIGYQGIRFDRSRANFLVLDICLRYLDMWGLDNDEKMTRYERGLAGQVGLDDSKKQDSEKEFDIFIGYAREYWQDHALGMMDFEQAIQKIRKLPNMAILRDRLLLRAAERGHDRVLSILLKDMGASTIVEDRDGKSALHLAALGGHVSTVQLLLDHGANLEQRDSIGATALHWAASGGEFGTFTQLFAMHKKHRQEQEKRHARNSAGALLFFSRQWMVGIYWLISGAWLRSTEDHTGGTADVEMPDEEGGTLLAWALESGSEKVIRFLLANDAKTDIRYFQDPRRIVLGKNDLKFIHLIMQLFEDFIKTLEHPGTYHMQRTPLARAAEHGLGEVVQLLLDYGADPNFDDLSKRTAVFWAAKNQHMVIIKMLKEYGAECNSQLELAVLRGQVSVVQNLITNGDADPNWENKIGLSPICWAAMVGNKDVMDALLENDRTDTESKTPELRLTPLGLAAAFGRDDVVEPLIIKGRANVNWVDETFSTPLSWAVYLGHNNVVKSILASGKADLSHTDDIGRTALMISAMMGDEAAFGALLQQDKNVNRTDAFGRSAIFSAIRGGNRQIIDALLSCPRLDISTADFYGATCLSIAARFGDNITIQELLRRSNTKKSFLSHQDNFGKSPLDWAILKGHSSTKRVLLGTYDVLGLSTRGAKLVLPRILSSKIAKGPQAWPHPFCDVCYFNVEKTELYYTCGLCFKSTSSFVCCQNCWTTLQPRPKCKGPRHKLYLRMIDQYED
ncbi:hypothetical protein BPAE_0505g00020 [Botrytis paeoniae]|uniref:AAA+ ATPase domain-containing protein n=1 Tax=Botrytis paeoniae TaxID=278948 RepID=A0A4Z1F574_9HELO|nr:hypothetical protein BPAE_0505g00020 [Botrytis paeoniae]